MRQFDHVGIITDERQAEEMYVPATKVWVTNPATHPYKIEHLRYGPDTPVTGPVRNMPHIAFRVDNLEEAMGNSEVLLGPFNPRGKMRVVFVLQDGAVFEFMENAEDGNWFRATDKPDQ
ncbi:MAG: hypothetical protein HYR94_07535 [Chloroflexi bacterium]|nr:hypothetical protein [Chloroflexota bacterium]